MMLILYYVAIYIVAFVVDYFFIAGYVLRERSKGIELGETFLVEVSNYSRVEQFTQLEILSVQHCRLLKLLRELL